MLNQAAGPYIIKLTSLDCHVNNTWVKRCNQCFFVINDSVPHPTFTPSPCLSVYVSVSHTLCLSSRLPLYFIFLSKWWKLQAFLSWWLWIRLCTCSGRINRGNAEASIYANKYSLHFCLQKQACNSEKLPFK